MYRRNLKSGENRIFLLRLRKAFFIFSLLSFFSLLLLLLLLLVSLEPIRVQGSSLFPVGAALRVLNHLLHSSSESVIFSIQICIA